MHRTKQTYLLIRAFIRLSSYIRMTSENSEITVHITFKKVEEIPKAAVYLTVICLVRICENWQYLGVCKVV